MSPLTEPTRLTLAKGQPVPNDPSYSFTSLLLHGEVDPMVDSSSGRHSLSTTGATTSAVIVKFGAKSILFNGVSGVSQWLDAPSLAGPVGTENFTIEAWIYPLEIGRDSVILDTRLPSSTLDGNASSAGFAFFINSTNKLQVYDGGAASLRTASVTQSIALGSAVGWQHIALVKLGSTHTYYIGGTNYGSFTATNTSGPSNCRVGARNDQRFGFNGYIDDLRITKGVARYVEGTGANAGKMVFAGTNTLALPTAPFPDF